jgi:inner membrane protein
MPTPISHGLVAVLFGDIFSKTKSAKFWTLSLICSVLPDIDVVAVMYIVPLEHMFGHRGFSHSMFFVLLAALLIVFFGFREIKHFSKEWWTYAGYFFLIGLSHIIFDAMTSGGQGVGLFMPFCNERYLLPFRPIRVSPLRLMRFFTSEGKRILVSEAFWIWIPVALYFIVSRFVKMQRNKSTL